MADDDGSEVLDLGVVDEPEQPGAAGLPPRRPGSTPSRRALLALAGVAVVGGGAVVVRSRSSSPPPARSAPTPTPSASALPTSAGLDGPDVVVTDLRRPLLAGGRGDVFGFGPNAIVRVELGTGRVTRTRMPQLSDSPTFVPVRGGVLVHLGDVGATYVVPDGSGPQEAPRGLLGIGPMLPGPDLDHVWLVSTSGSQPTLRLVGIDGRPTGTAVGLPQYGSSDPTPDGGGFPLLQGLGGTYWARAPQGLQRITTGTVVAAGRTGWLVIDCDDRDRCSGARVDRSGHRSSVPGLVNGDLAVGYGVPSGALAPGGDRAAIYVGDPQKDVRLVLLDLRTGNRTRTDLTLVPGAPSQSLVWSPDGRWVFAVDASARIVAVDPRTGTVRPLVPGTIVPAIPVVQEVAVR